MCDKVLKCEAGTHTIPVKLWWGMTCPHCVGKVSQCVDCGQETTGSIGVAGVVWSMLCQTCKDKHDHALHEQIKVQSVVMGTRFGELPLDCEEM